MKEIAFSELAALPYLKHYEKAFFKATRVSLKLLPPDEKMRRANLRQSENPFCAFVSGTPEGCKACLETQRRIEQASVRELVTQQTSCFAGLTDIAIPVVVAGRHVATLLSGQIFRREPTRQDFELMVERIGGGPDKEWVKRAREAYFDTPVIPADSLQAVIELLNVFARHLSEDITRHFVTTLPDIEPDVVSSAKKFVESHSQEPITLDQVLQHVHASRFHFCKVFKKTTGITFTEYVARVRAEMAKTLLKDPSLRVSEVVFAAGFGSIPQFNSVFKRIVGLSPTEYRAQLRRNHQGHESGVAPRADKQFSSRNIGQSDEDDDAIPDNIIRTSSFRPDEDGVIRAGPSHHHARRAARA